VVMIDLGDLGAPQKPRPDRRPRHRFRWRDLGLALVAVLCLATLQSVPESRPMIRTSWTSPYDRTLSVEVGQDTVYALRLVGDVGELMAHDLATGRVRWTSPALSAVIAQTRIQVFPASGLVVLSTNDLVTVLDAATGARLWETVGAVLGEATGTLLLLQHHDGWTGALRLARARDGTIIWEQPAGDVRTVEIQQRDGRPVSIAVDDGELTLFRYDDGAVLARKAADEFDVSQLTFAGDRLLVSRLEDDRFVTTAHRLDDLTEIWRAEAPGWGAVKDCGQVICLISTEGIAGLDPGTGAERWSTPAAHDVASIGGGRLVKYENPRSSFENPLVSVLDAATGGRVGAGVYGHPEFSVTDRRLLVLRPHGAATEPSSVYDVDPDTGRSVLLGEVGYELRSEKRRLAGRHQVRLREDRVQVMTFG
jgi:outer membrane protein assembly factor BamB